MNRLSTLDQIFEDHLQTLALVLRPATVYQYRCVARRFLLYLHATFPQVRHFSQLCRDPHLLGWFRWLCAQDPPLCNKTRSNHLLQLRRLLNDLAANGYAIQPGLIRLQDFPPPPKYLPRPLSIQDDQLLQQELCRTDDLPANALLLIRATGIRIGECVDLPPDCLRQFGPEQCALHVPLGKLHTERLVPLDEEGQRLVARLLALRALAPPTTSLIKSEYWLLPRQSRDGLFRILRYQLAAAAKRAGCSGPVTPHRLRHSWATEMLRLGVSLPALMEMLGHRDIRMTLRYVQVTQQDLQREFHLARQNAAQRHLVPKLLLTDNAALVHSDLPGIGRALAAARHLLEMYRRQLRDEHSRQKLQRLDKRLLSVAMELDRLTTPEK